MMETCPYCDFTSDGRLVAHACTGTKKEIPVVKRARSSFWMRVYIAVAGSNNCTDADIPATWADRALEEFDERFPELKQEEKQ